LRKLKQYIRLILLSTILCITACEEVEVVYDHNQQLATDIAIIDAYLEEQNISAQIHPSGMRYTVLEEGEAGDLQADDGLLYYASVRRLDEEPFETYNSGLIDEFSMINGLILDPFFKEHYWSCFHEASKFMRKNGRIRMYVPSGLSLRDLPQTRFVEDNNEFIGVIMPGKTVFVVEAIIRDQN